MERQRGRWHPRRLNCQAEGRESTGRPLLPRGAQRQLLHSRWIGRAPPQRPYTHFMHLLGYPMASLGVRKQYMVLVDTSQQFRAGPSARSLENGRKPHIARHFGRSSARRGPFLPILALRGRSGVPSTPCPILVENAADGRAHGANAKCILALPCVFER